MKSLISKRQTNQSCPKLLSLTILALVCIGASYPASAVQPPPDGGYPNNNTAEGDGALANDAPGFDNTGIGFNALMSVVSPGGGNVGVGSHALSATTTGSANVAIGFQSLIANTTGGFNIALGVNAMVANITGSYNVAIGEEALQAHTAGGDNVAVGSGAMALGTSGSYNTAIGSTAMAFANGNDNIAVGDGALNAANGDENIGIGQQACLNCAGDNNIAIGQFAGQSVTSGASNVLLGQNAGLNITTGSNNIEIATAGTKKDSGVIRIGDAAAQKKTFIAGISGVTVSGAAVMVNSKGQLGIATSSARYKEAIKPMKEASEAILSLKPVTYRYKKELDPQRIPQFGLVAEEVAKVDPDLVLKDDQGHPYTVRHEAVNAMLLNEFLKEHKTVEKQSATIVKMESAAAGQEEKIARLQASLSEQQREIANLVTTMKQQAAELRQVSEQVQAKPPPRQLVADR
jgi:uncharacterized coiled-coil protein SlyX